MEPSIQELRRELLHPKPQTRILGQESGHWLHDKAVVSLRRATPKLKHFSALSHDNNAKALPYVYIQDYKHDQFRSTVWTSAERGEGKKLRIPITSLTQYQTPPKQRPEVLHSLLQIEKKRFQELSKTQAMNQWKKSQHDSILISAQEAAIAVSAQRRDPSFELAVRKMIGRSKKSLMRRSDPSYSSRGLGKKSVSDDRFSKRRPVTPQEFMKGHKMLQNQDSADQLLDSKLIAQNPESSRLRQQQMDTSRFSITRIIPAPGAELILRQSASPVTPNSMDKKPSRTESVNTYKIKSKKFIHDVAISAHPLTSATSLTPHVDAPLSNTPEGLKKHFTKYVSGEELLKSQEMVESAEPSVDLKLDSTSRAPHQISINEISGIESVQGGGSSARDQHRIQLPYLVEKVSKHVNVTQHNSPTTRRTLKFNPNSLFPSERATTPNRSVSPKRRAMPSNIIYTNYTRGVQSKVEQGENKALHEATSNYKSPQKWLKNPHSNLSFSAASYKPDLTAQRLRNRITDLDPGQKQVSVSSRDVVNRLYPQQQKSVILDDTSSLQQISYTMSPKHQQEHISIVNQDKQTELFSVSTSTINASAMFAKSQKTPHSYGAVHFPDIDFRRESRNLLSPALMSKYSSPSTKKSRATRNTKKMAYKSPIDYLRRNKPSRAKSRNAEAPEEDLIEYEDHLWSMQQPKKFPYLKEKSKVSQNV